MTSGVPPRPGVRVATYNTRDFLDDRSAAASVVRTIAPDVLCLQEVPRRLFAPRRVARFAAQCRMRWVGPHRGSGGTTILTSSRVQVLQASHRRLRTHWPDRTRGYAVVLLGLPAGGELVVASVHLSLVAAERERHVHRILEDLGRRDRVVVCGDLNEDSTGAAYGVLGTAGLRLVSPAEPTYPARAPRRQLDVVLASPDVAVLPHVPVALSEVDVVRASDHRPVWVDLDG